MKHIQKVSMMMIPGIIPGIILGIILFSALGFSGGSNVTGGGDYRETKIREAKQLMITALKLVSEEILTTHEATPDTLALYKQYGLAIAQDLSCHSSGHSSELNFFSQEKDRKEFIIDGEEKTFKTTHKPCSPIDTNLLRAEELHMTVEGAAALLAREGARHLSIQDQATLSKIEEMALSVLTVYQKIQKGIKSDAEFKAELISHIRSFFDLLPKATPTEADTTSLIQKLKNLKNSADYQTCIAPSFWTSGQKRKRACQNIIDAVQNFPVTFRKTITDNKDSKAGFSENQAHFAQWFEAFTEPSHQLYALLSLHWVTEQYNTLHLTRILGKYNGDLYTAAAGKEGEPDRPLAEIVQKLADRMLLAFETDFPKILEENQKAVSTLFTKFCENTQKAGFDFTFFNGLPSLRDKDFTSFKEEFLLKLHTFELVVMTPLALNLQSYEDKVNELKNSPSYQTCTNPGFFTSRTTVWSECNALLANINGLHAQFTSDFNNANQTMSREDVHFTNYVNALKPPLHHDIANIVKSVLNKQIAQHFTHLSDQINTIFNDMNQQYDKEKNKNYPAGIKFLTDKCFEIFKNSYPDAFAETQQNISNEILAIKNILTSL